MDQSVLASRLGTLLGEHHPVAAAALVAPSGATTVSLGASGSAEFEIGSISKGVTGLLYAQARERREISGSTTLGELLPLGTSPAAGVRLTALAVHRSGLPTIPLNWDNVRRSAELVRHGANPYGESVPELLAAARRVRLRRPRFRYSNLGYQLLGHALASAAGLTYPELVRRRVAEPLGIGTFTAPASADELGPLALEGRGADGEPQEPWTGEALAPAGGLRATIEDMATFAAALADGTAPGIEALDPVVEEWRRAPIGAAWITSERNGRAVTWHNGMTGGFASWLGVDREARVAVVVLTAVARPVDEAGFALLAEAVEPIAAGS